MIIARDMRLDLVFRIRRNLALEACIDAPEDKAERAALAGRGELFLEQGGALDHDAGHQGRARDVQVRKVRRVGLVHVEVEFHDGRARVDADGVEELGAGSRGLLNCGSN